MPTDSPDGQQERRFIVGIGVGEYDDASLNLEAVPADVQAITEWFATRTHLPHERALPELAQSPTLGDISSKLPEWLNACRPDDVVVIYIAAHGELYGKNAYILARDSPRTKLAGRALTGETLGAIIGQAPPHKVLVIVDACVAGKLGSAIQRAAEDVADDENLRDPRRRYAQAVLCSTFSRDPANDGLFAKTFLKVVSQERLTGTALPWIEIDRLMTWLNDELKDLPQVAERKVWGTGAADLIPNPNFGKRRWSTLIADEELATHFDPASRGVSQNEAGWYFTGRRKELARVAQWLVKPDTGTKPFVVTGSPGSGKSALVARVFTLSDETRRNALPDLASVPPETIPPAGSIDAVLWCHNKSPDQLVGDLANRLGFNARTADELFAAVRVEPRKVSILVDALDEAVEGEAPKIAANFVKPLAALPNVKLTVATRRHPVRSGEGNESKDLLEALGVSTDDENCLVLDKAQDRAGDMREYITARLMASPSYSDRASAERLAEKIARAAGNSFLVAAVTARTFALQEKAVDPDHVTLPKDAGAALAAYIDRLPEPDVAADILRPLAWAQGAGSPWGRVWAPVATALANAVHPRKHVEYDDTTVARVLDAASDLIVESVEYGEPVYRLFHEALAEHLRAEVEWEPAHTAIAGALGAALGTPPYVNAPPYVLAHLPFHLWMADKSERLYKLATDPEWERAKRLRFGNGTLFLRDVELAVHTADIDEAKSRFAGACTVYGRMMAVAPAVVTGVIARGGQAQRAELMANNIEFAVDRCLAYSLIASAFAADKDAASAQRCLAEAERAIAAIDATHSAMAWAWVSRAAVECGFRDAAARVSANALEAARSVHGLWEFDNAVFWAAMAARTAGDQQSTQALAAMFTAVERIPGRNQYLQAASVLGLQDVLRDVWHNVRENRFGTFVRDGNLALALADAGMTEELGELLEAIAKEGGPSGEDDAQKRYAWALAISGDLEGALAHVLTIGHEEHRVRALGRVVSVAVERNDGNVLAEAKKLAGQLTGTSKWRLQALLAPILFALQEMQEAMRLAEEVVRQEITPSQEQTVAFPPSEQAASAIDSRSRFLKTVRRGGKTTRKALQTDIGPLRDAAVLEEVAKLVAAGELYRASRQLDEIHVPRLKWEGWRMIAEATHGVRDAHDPWRNALFSAGMVSELAVRETVRVMAERGVPDGEAMLAEVARINARWTEAGFAEHYESLRSSLRPGSERTRLMDNLMILETRIIFAWWDQKRVKQLAGSNAEGQRVFALALMESAPELADFDVVLKMIRTSLSAFEQYHALKVMLELVKKTITAEQRERLLAELAAERQRYITPGTDREALARQIERAVAKLG